MYNTTRSDVPPLPSYTLESLPPLLAPIPDKLLTLLLPIAAYWILSLFFHVIDIYDILSQYRLHTPAEVLKRNRVPRSDVLRDVIIQQLIQTAIGIILGMTEPEDTFGKADYDMAVWAQRLRRAQRVLPGMLALVGIDAISLGKSLAPSHPTLAGAILGGHYPPLLQGLRLSAGAEVVSPVFAPWEMKTAKIIYSFVVPAAQFALAIVIVDTWQYFLHRAMHMNQWMYRTFHSRHHRLYVPYAFGALYNHPFEGFLLDTLGAAVAFKAAGMTTRQGMWFFTCSTIKTVDDHCGYALPWDPLQHLTSNNAGYHDVHHQSWGIKTNFSQPFFTFWDRLLGTCWTGGDVSARYEKSRVAAQKRMDGDSITQSQPSDHDPRPYGSSTSTQQVTLFPDQAISDKAALQTISSRAQVLSDTQPSASPSGGISVVAQEAEEELEARRNLRRAARKKKSSISSQQTTGNLKKSLTGKVSGSLHGRGSGVLGVESSG
ncbi:MAG: hypothetical protein M1817_001145 [Caeruleum heppii]|nr:MAG: hypothetical protein M1817_001145 [Caeruleum heppii]